MQDWNDGFLAVGNHPVLDLLNTHLVVDGEAHEMLTDTDALVRWLRVCGLTAPPTEAKLRSWSARKEAETFLRDLLLFREALRDAVFRIEEGKQPRKEFLAELNELLAAHPYRLAIVTEHGITSTAQAEGTSFADTLWAALLRQVVQLLTEADPARLRKCESCVTHFHDLSKKNARRWCSMRLCGNKVKVAAYQERQRQAGFEKP